MGTRKRNEIHIHKLVKSGPVWKCAFPDCRFFVYFKQEYVILGRQTICWDCGNAFPLDELAMKEEMPTCTACRIPEMNEINTILPKRLEG
jgi:hypothetical protein